MSDQIVNPEPQQGQVQEPTSPEGQEVTPPIASGQEDYFYSFTDPGKDETHNFRTQEELNDYVGNLNKSYGELRKKFTQTSQEYADRNRTYENDRAEYNRRLAELEEKEKRVNKYDSYLKNNPHVYKELKRRIDSGPKTGDINVLVENKIKEIYGKDFEELKAHKARQDSERLREAAFTELRKKYGEINTETILERFEKLSSGNLTDVYELIHLSNGGSPAAQAQQQKNGAGLLPSSTGKTSSSVPLSKAKSIDEWVEAQQNAY
jgi:hypothetical protein